MHACPPLCHTQASGARLGTLSVNIAAETLGHRQARELVHTLCALWPHLSLTPEELLVLQAPGAPPRGLPGGTSAGTPSTGSLAGAAITPGRGRRRQEQQQQQQAYPQGLPSPRPWGSPSATAQKGYGVLWVQVGLRPGFFLQPLQDQPLPVVAPPAWMAGAAGAQPGVSMQGWEGAGGPAHGYHTAMLLLNWLSADATASEESPQEGPESMEMGATGASGGVEGLAAAAAENGLGSPGSAAAGALAGAAGEPSAGAAEGSNTAGAGAAAAGGSVAVPEAGTTAGGHDVRDEIFAMVKPTGWTVELPDPHGKVLACYGSSPDQAPGFNRYS